VLLFLVLLAAVATPWSVAARTKLALSPSAARVTRVHRRYFFTAKTNGCTTTILFVSGGWPASSTSSPLTCRGAARRQGWQDGYCAADSCDGVNPCDVIGSNFKWRCVRVPVSESPL
jgi:hypothetical protein